jgi:hypothetical protein
MYEEYLKSNPEGSYDYVSKEVYVDIVESFSKYIAECVVDKGLIIDLPFNKGKLGIFKWMSKQSRNLTKVPIDWVKSKALGKRVYLTNSHSNGYTYGFIWNKELRQANLLSCYKFRPARNLTRKLAMMIKTKQNDYFLK